MTNLSFIWRAVGIRIAGNAGHISSAFQIEISNRNSAEPSGVPS